jgi:predicted metal-dependent phosphoesterase TrpH
MTVPAGAFGGGAADREVAEQAVADRAAADRAFIDLHCHTSASFDSLATVAAVVRAAAARGLTHLAVTDHDRIDAAIRARDIAPPELTIIIGEEVKTVDGDLIAVFLDKVVPPGMSALETIAAVREQGGLVGVPHPFDRFRGFGHKSGLLLDEIADKVDWIEAYNARVLGGSANERAAAFAREHNLPGVCASDSHTVIEVGVSSTVVFGDPGTAAGLLAALAHVEMHPARATFYVRAWTPLAKMIQALRGNGRIRAAAPGETE